MTIVVPFTNLKEATQLALRQDGLQPLFEHMRHEEDYYNLLARMWEKGETFLVVEHDIVAWPGAAQTLENCPGLWCTLPYYCSVGWIKDGLGFTKFSAELLKKYPDFLKEPFPTCCRHSRYYCGLDRLIAHRAAELGIQPCVHEPGCTNLNEKWT